MFTTEFGRYVCEGDTISCVVDGLDCVATVYRDDCSDKPDERDDGFWPSLDPESAGYIGPKSESTLRRHTARAQAVMDAWLADEWFYCGVAVTVSKAGIQLTHRYDRALWGIECNYPTRGKERPNTYLREVANELLDEAIFNARAKLLDLCAA